MILLLSKTYDFIGLYLPLSFSSGLMFSLDCTSTSIFVGTHVLLDCTCTSTFIYVRPYVFIGLYLPLSFFWEFSIAL